MDYDAFWHEISERREARGHGLAVFRRVPSTHEVGRRLVREYADEGARLPIFDLLAWEQEAGRGRDDRAWSSPAGAGAWITLVRPSLRGPLQRLPLLVAVALAEALSPWIGSRLRLEWPNDLVIEGKGGWKKLGGILLALTSRGEGTGHAVISFGINHARAVEVFGQPRATSLLAALPPSADEGPSLADLAVETIDALDRRLGTRNQASPAPTDAAGGQTGLGAADLLDLYRQWSRHRPGEELICRTGEETIRGRFLGFDAQGFLRLAVLDGGTERETKIGAGDLVEELPAPAEKDAAPDAAP